MLSIVVSFFVAVTISISSGSVVVSPKEGNHIVHVNFDNVTTISQTTATLQVVSNPILDTKYSPIAPTLFDNLAALKADLVRYAAWYPYPVVGVAELEPPDVKTRTTSWKFSDELQQQFLDVWKSVVTKGGQRLVITFSTQPAWMFNTTDWSYSNDTSRSDWRYARGTWMPSTTQLVADYYARLASWMVLGEFQDEFGNTITGGPKFGLGKENGGVTHWEIFNEPEAEHHLTPHQYNLLYDAIVRAIRDAVDPDHTIEFVGMALALHREWDWWKTFLNPSNHAVDVQDAVANGYASFHFYGRFSSRTNVSTYQEVWDRVDDFEDEVDQIIALRDELSPTTKLAVNELGVIPNDDNQKGAPDVPPIYYNMAAAVYTTLLLKLSLRGVDIVGSSQYCGCPDIPEWGIPDRQYPGVSMTNWTTGSGNPRYWALKMMNEKVGPGDSIVYTFVVSPKQQGRNSDVIAQARVTAQGGKLVILVNKSDQKRRVTLPFIEFMDRSGGNITYKVSVVDTLSHDGPWREYTIQSPLVTLNGFAVAVIEVVGAEKTSYST
ncbi:glycosyl hydrolase family 39 protein [Nitzschia inconspicua]|uniref:Glycosyl hydrolase family 39 protein n=1 Tax=Nitzschia inconspicua TaxID=303405 RepID=A0A9K3KU49_9STRA|nr:glycosyl hydrolase family 39 protein [Nitzschia inconspicua]